MTSTISDNHQLPDVVAFELDQRRAKAYAESGYWPDAKAVAQALVKIEAGRALNIPPLMAMNEVHVIDGKPGLGAGALAALVKNSGRYDYRIVELTGEKCSIRFYDNGRALTPESVFTLQDAKTAGLLDNPKRQAWRQYPRNMLFARAMSNGVAWFAPDAIGGRFYTGEEMQLDQEEQPVEAEVVDEVPV